MFASVDEVEDDDEDLYPDSDVVDPDAEPVPAIDLSLAPGARLTLQVQCAAAVPELLARTEVLDTVEAVGMLQRWLAGVRIRMLAEFADRHSDGSLTAPPGADESGLVPSQRWVPDEIAMTESVSRLEALGEIAQAQRFVHVLPATLSLLEQGRIDLRRAEAIARATAVLPDDKARTAEAAVLAAAPEATLRQLRDRLRRAIARIDPDGEYRRHRRANTERRVSIRSLEDGMASLWFYGSAAEIEAAWQSVDRLARSLGADDPRTLDQRRFDLAAQVLQGRLTVTDLSDVDAAVTEILVDVPHDAEAADETEAGHADGPAGSGRRDGLPGGGPPPGVEISPDALAEAVAQALSRRPDLHATVRRPLIHVVVGMETLLGADRPAELVGHGPIDAATARTLAADGVWKRLLTDPPSGTLLDVGRTSYTPPAGIADHVRARDQICRGPQCGRRIRDVDHHQEWRRDGHTAEPNLFGYCRHHHKLKDAPGWQVIAHPDRSLTWISPCGRRQRTEPFDYRPFTDDLPTQKPTPAEADAGGTDPGAGVDDPPPPF